MNFDGKIALATGTASGLGQAIALDPAPSGADIALRDKQLACFGKSENLLKSLDGGFLL